MKSSKLSSAFTLIEMITVIAIITILAGLVISLANMAQTKGYRAKAEADRSALVSGCENYRADNGEYPQNAQTDALNPRTAFNPNASNYTASNLAFYKLLSGDEDASGTISGAEVGRKYMTDFFRPSRFNSSYKDNIGSAGAVKYIVDPFSNPYGYSTAGLKAEQDARTTGSRDSSQGYNATFDVWSTGGASSDKDKGKWIKNWP